MVKDHTWTFEQISSSHLSFLRLIALIPFENRKLSYIGTRLLSIYCHIINTIYNTMFSGYGIRMVAQKKSIEVDYICEMVVVESVCLRYLILYLNRKKVMSLIQSCKDLWSYLNDEESEIVRSFERKAHYFRTFMLANSMAVVTLFILTARFVRLPPLDVNGTERRMLPFRFYVDVQEDPMFTIVSAFEAVVTYSIPIVIAGSETVALFLIMMACGYLRLIQIRLLSLSEIENKVLLQNHEFRNNNTDKLIYDYVLVCAQFHQKIMVFCENLERLTRSIFFVMVFTTVYNMSITGIKLLENDENKFKFMAILVLNLFQFFTCQWAPEYLLMESEAIGTAAYFASLEQANRSTNRLLYFMMIRAQRPMQLTAGGYINLSIESFGSMIKSAFSFFAVLRSFSS